MAIPESILKKIEHLERNIEQLERLRIRGLTKAKLAEDFNAQDIAIHNLEIGATAIMDIGNFILATFFHRGAAQYKDIFIRLGKHKVLSKKLAEQGEEIADFRNLSVHVYETVDVAQVFDILRHAPEDFRAYLQALTNFLRKVRTS